MRPCGMLTLRDKSDLRPELGNGSASVHGSGTSVQWIDNTQPIWSGANNLALIATSVPAFVCPSTTNLPPQTCTWSAATQALGGSSIGGITPPPPLPQTWGRADYIVNTDIRSPLSSNVLSMQAGGAGTIGRHAFFLYGRQKRQCCRWCPRFAGRSTGCVRRFAIDRKSTGRSVQTSIMVESWPLVNQLWEKGRSITPAIDTSAAFAKLYNQQLNYGGGGWADPNNDQWVDVANATETRCALTATAIRTRCVINCTNLSARHSTRSTREFRNSPWETVPSGPSAKTSAITSRVTPDTGQAAILLANSESSRDVWQVLASRGFDFSLRDDQFVRLIPGNTESVRTFFPSQSERTSQSA